MSRYAIVNNETVAGVVNWDGAEAHPYGAVELRGPLPEGEGLETWDGRPAADIPLQASNISHPGAEAVAAILPVARRGKKSGGRGAVKSGPRRAPKPTK
jgi:hypothetical protein